MAANPFVAGDSGDPTAGLPDTKTFDDIRSQWSSFLDKPEGRAALLSFGINLMQPPGFGDTPMGQIGRAIGAAGETGTNIEKLDIAQQEAASKEALRAQTAETAAMRAAAFGTGQQLGLERIANQRSQIEQTGKLRMLQAQLQLQGMYGKEKKAFESDIINRPPIGSPGHEFPSYSEWLVSSPEARATAIEAGIQIPGPAPAVTPGATPETKKTLHYDKEGNRIP